MPLARKIGPRRSLLFVPADRPERFTKAAASGADIVCLDLEDGVQPAAKAAARTHMLEFLNGERVSCELAVRINALQTQAGLQDLLALANSALLPDLIVLPKVESPDEIEWVARLTGAARMSPGIVALVESPKGLTRLNGIATASATTLLGLGTADLAASMNVTMEWEPMLLARMQVAQAAALAGIGAIDGAWLQLDDTQGLAQESRRAAALGFTAKLCIHPKQVPSVHATFAVNDRQAEEARRLITAFEAAGGCPLQLNGRMVDLPVVISARRRLRLWEDSRQTSADAQ